VSLTVKPGAIGLLTGYYPELDQLPPHLREDGQTVYYLIPAGRPAQSGRSCPVGWIIFPHYSPDVVTELRSVSRPEALRRLLHECLVLPELMDRAGVESLVHWIRSVECLELPMSSLPDAVDWSSGWAESQGHERLEHSRVGAVAGRRRGRPEWLRALRRTPHSPPRRAGRVPSRPPDRRPHSPSGPPYLRLPLQFDKSLEPRLLKLVSAADLSSLRTAAEGEHRESARCGTTFTLIKAWARLLA
jgi:hypothetical protein